MKVSGAEWGFLGVPNGLALEPRKRPGPNLFRAEQMGLTSNLYVKFAVKK